MWKVHIATGRHHRRGPGDRDRLGAGGMRHLEVVVLDARSGTLNSADLIC